MNVILMDAKWMLEHSIETEGTYVGSNKDNRAILFIKDIENILISYKIDINTLELGATYSCNLILYRRYVRDKDNKFIQTDVTKYIAEL